MKAYDVFAMGTVFGCVLLFVILKLMSRKSKYRCPWMYCGFSLNPNQLQDKNGNYMSEECPACENLVRWDLHKGRYQRLKALQ